MVSVDILFYSVFENESRSGPKLPHRFSPRFLSNHVILFISSVEIYSLILNQSLSIKNTTTICNIGEKIAFYRGIIRLLDACKIISMINYMTELVTGRSFSS